MNFATGDFSRLPKLPKLRLPSRNWLIFLSITSSLLSLYVYDRRQCRLIRQSYVEKVKHLAEDPLQPRDLPRRVTVYACRPPGDDDHNRSLRFFKRYLKPILVAAAIDYRLENGNRYGALASTIAEKIRVRRRLALGLDPPPASMLPLPHQLSQQEKEERDLQGGSIIIGRHTFKEFMAGHHRGWTEPLDTVDEEEQLAEQLQTDGVFDEPDQEVLPDNPQPQPLPIQLRPFIPLTPLQRPPSTKSAVPLHLNEPPATIPPQPPLLLVPFTNRLGFKNVPFMIYDFFNERKKVQIGAEAAYRLVLGHTRPFIPPPSETSDILFDEQTEQQWRSTFVKLPETIEKARKEYYSALSGKIATARALQRGTRPPTKDEIAYPPPTEVELRAERLKKELRWRSDLAGWEILRPGQPVEWDPRFEGVLRVFARAEQG